MLQKNNIPIFKKLHMLSFLIGALSIVLPIVFWGRIPEQIPIHYNGLGVADNWGDKSTLVLLFFCIAMLMGLMSIAVYFVKSNMESKYSGDYEKSEMSMVYPMLIITNLVLQLTMAYITFCSVFCRPLGVLFLPICLIGVFWPIVYMIYKRGKVKAAYGLDEAAYKAIEKQQIGKKYRTAVDWWLGLLLAGSELMVIWYAIEPIIKEGEIDWGMLLLAIGISIIILPLFAIKYVMFEDHMLISMSIYGKERVRYTDIVEVKETFNPISSAALSLKRIQIDYVENGIHGMILVSPVRREEFMEALKEKRGLL